MRTLVPAALLLLAPAAGAAPVPKEGPRPALEGKYNLTSVTTGPAQPVAPGGGLVVPRDRTHIYLPGPATITKDRLVLEGRAPVGLTGLNLPLTMEYAVVDATKTPVHVDVFNVTPRGKKTKLAGLAEVVDDRLILAVAKEGDERPKNTEEAEGVTVYYFQKAPQPKVEFKIVALTVGREAEAEKELNRLALEGYELVSTTTAAPDAKSSPTTTHLVLKRTGK
jgi:hypothetical protein